MTFIAPESKKNKSEVYYSPGAHTGQEKQESLMVPSISLWMLPPQNTVYLFTSSDNNFLGNWFGVIASKSYQHWNTAWPSYWLWMYS